jgi:phosphoribosylanthranilate isomerase
MILKICGITNQEDATAAVEGGANAIGFNFYPSSPRYIAPERAAEIATPAGVRRVGVFVNERRGRVEDVACVARLGVAQLHGDEDPAEYPAGLAVWKGVRVTEGFDLARYDGCPAEALLLDGPAGDVYGGSGKGFDWKVASKNKKAALQAAGPAESESAGRSACPTKTRIILAGGLDGSNVARAIAAAHPWGVDACSRIESAPGKKDLRKMRAFLEAAGAALGA